MTEDNKKANPEHFAIAKSMNLPVSTKHCIEISRNLRYKNTKSAKDFLEDVIVLKKPVVFRKFTRDMGHKAGISSGRYPQKAAAEFLRLIKSVEANAQFKGLNTSNLKITKILANKASVPATGGRHRRDTKRTNIEIEVKERTVGKKDEKKKAVKKEEKKTEQGQKEETKQANPTENIKEEKKLDTIEKVAETKQETPIASEESSKPADSDQPAQPTQEEVKEQVKVEEKVEEENVEEELKEEEKVEPTKEVNDQNDKIETPQEEGEKQ